MQPDKCLVLLSGGFDSAVASYFMVRKGLKVSALHFSSEPLTNNYPEVKARQICKTLGIRTLHVINLSAQLELIAKLCRRELYFVLMKRLMLRLAEQVARREGCAFLVTGESIGQVSSQTLSNLAAITQATRLPVIRPLAGFNKEEIINMAKAIGTYYISKGPEVCDLLGPKHPATRVKTKEVLEEEAKLNTPEMVTAALKTERVSSLEARRPLKPSERILLSSAWQINFPA